MVGEGEEGNDDGNFYCFTCWLVYHAARARLRRDSAHVQPKRNFQGVSCAPGSAQQGRIVQNVSFTFGQQPQLQRPGACTERCTVQNASSVFEQRAQRACTQITTQAAHAHDHEAEFTKVGGWDTSSDSDEGDSAVEGSDEGDRAVEGSDEGDRAVEGSEEHFDESEPVDDGLADEERSTDGEDRSGQEVAESEEERCCSPEGSDFAAEEGYEEGDSNAEEGHEEVWGEVHEDYDEAALCARSQASRSSSSSSSRGFQCGLRVCLVYLYLLEY